MSFQPTFGGKAFALCVAMSVVLLLIVFRLLTGAGFGFQDAAVRPDGMFSSGFLFNLYDNLQYVSFAEQARHGSWLFSDLYTTERHAAIYLNPYFLLVGRISRATGVPVTAIMIFAGMIGVAVVVLVSFHTAIRLGFPESAAKWSCLFVAYASGIFSFVWLLHHLFGTELLFGADVAYQDAILFSNFFAYPYHTVSLALMALLIWFIVSYHRENVVHKRCVLFLIPVLTMFLGLTRPYEIVMLVASYCFFVMIILARDKSAFGASLTIPLLLVVGEAPVVVYHSWMSQQPVWNFLASSGLNFPAPPVTWLVGYGTMLPLSLAGGWLCLRNSKYFNGLWFAIWVCLIVLLLIVLRIPQTKVCSGAHFPMCVLAGLGFSEILKRAHHVKTYTFRLLCYTAICIIIISSFATSFGLLLRVYRPVMCDAEVRNVLEQVRASADEPDSIPSVLCDSKVGLVAPGLGGVRVFVGNVWLTPDYKLKQAQLVEAGVEPVDRTSTAADANREVFRQLVDQEGFDYALLDTRSPADSFARDSDDMRLVGVYGRYALYEVIGRKKVK